VWLASNKAGSPLHSALSKPSCSGSAAFISQQLSAWLQLAVCGQHSCCRLQSTTVLCCLWLPALGAACRTTLAALQQFRVQRCAQQHLLRSSAARCQYAAASDTCCLTAKRFTLCCGAYANDLVPVLQESHPLSTGTLGSVSARQAWQVSAGCTALCYVSAIVPAPSSFCRSAG
jgi:hypothetical protein